jgi:glycosyltransferase involved in cell wall biosynthesis
MSKPSDNVTVIITCYNYGRYLPESLDSVLAQTYKDVDVVVLDDGSTDNTKEVAQQYASKHANVTYVHQENKGIVATRNRAIKLASGDYIIQLDADDWIDPDYVQKTMAVAEQTKSDIVYTQAKIFGRVEFETDYPEYNLEVLKHTNYIHISSLVHKRVYVNREYDRYLDNKRDEDWDVFLDACLDGHKAALCKDTFLHYRKHDAAVSRSDDYDNIFKEMLVRHHILNKQNAKHPDQMWYLSPYITMLEQNIEEYQRLEAVLEENEQLQQNLRDVQNKLVQLERQLQNRVVRRLQRYVGTAKSSFRR